MRITETLLTAIPKYCPHCGFKIRGYYHGVHNASLAELILCIIAVCLIAGFMMWWNYKIDKEYFK